MNSFWVNCFLFYYKNLLFSHCMKNYVFIFFLTLFLSLIGMYQTMHIGRRFWFGLCDYNEEFYSNDNTFSYNGKKGLRDLYKFCYDQGK